MTSRPPNAASARLPRHALWVVLACLWLAACAFGGDAPAAPDKSTAMPPLPSLMGDWYVAAHAPWFGERGRVASRYRLSTHDDSGIVLARSWREGFGEPLQADSSIARHEGPGPVWKMRAYRVLPMRLRVLEVDPDGRWMLLDSPGSDRAWVLSRAQVVDDEAYLELERRIRGHGVNTDKLRRVPQVPEQEGRLGFEAAAVPTPGR